MTRFHSRQQRRAVALAEFRDLAAAERLAARLVMEGVGAQVWTAEQALPLVPEGAPPLGPTVVVAGGDHRHAMALARLFDEVDRGTSVVAPPPQDLWHGGPVRPVLAGALLAALAAVVLVLLVSAVG